RSADASLYFLDRSATPYSSEHKVFRIAVSSPGPVGNVGKPSQQAKLFQAAVGIRIKKTPAAGPPIPVADFHSCSIFHRPVFFFFLQRGSLVENRLGRVTNKPPYWINDWRRLSSAIGTGSGTYAQMMSFEDSTIRIMCASCR